MSGKSTSVPLGLRCVTTWEKAALHCGHVAPLSLREAQRRMQVTVYGDALLLLRPVRVVHVVHEPQYVCPHPCKTATSASSGESRQIGHNICPSSSSASCVSCTSCWPSCAVAWCYSIVRALVCSCYPGVAHSRTTLHASFASSSRLSFCNTTSTRSSKPSAIMRVKNAAESPVLARDGVNSTGQSSRFSTCDE